MPKRQHVIRPAVPTDHAFLFATFLRNLWYAKTNTTTLKKDTWMGIQHQRLERIFASQPVLIACLPDDPDTILGYWFQNGSEDWVYVKPAFRADAFGVRESLIEASRLQAAQEK